MFTVPFTSDPAHSFQATLGGVKYTFDVRWNERAAHWTFDLTREPDGELLVAGVPLLLGQDVLAPYGLGIGGISGCDFSGQDLDAGPDDLGSDDTARVQFIYWTEKELDVMRLPGVPL